MVLGDYEKSSGNVIRIEIRHVLSNPEMEYVEFREWVRPRDKLVPTQLALCFSPKKLAWLRAVLAEAEMYFEGKKKEKISGAPGEVEDLSG